MTIAPRTEFEPTTVPLDDTDRSVTLMLDEEVTLPSLDTLKASVLAAIGEARCVRLDASRVAAFDFGFLQLLCAAQREASDRGRVIELVHLAPPLVDRALEAGFSSAILGEPQG